MALLCMRYQFRRDNISLIAWSMYPHIMYSHSQLDLYHIKSSNAGGDDREAKKASRDAHSLPSQRRSQKQIQSVQIQYVLLRLSNEN